MQLDDLRDNPGATKKRKRVGRGIGSGSGKTSGRGHKGQKSRSGVAIKGFEGGQNPIHMRLPKRGFNNPSRLNYAECNLDRLQAAVDAGVLDPSKTVDGASLVAARIIRRLNDGVRLLGRGELKAKLNIEVSGASESAVKAVEAAGGSVTLIKPAKQDDAGDEAAKPAKAAAKKTS